MHSLPLVVLLTLAAGPDRTVPVGCREDFQTCREDCTIDYGGSTTKYRQLSLCIQGCDKEQAECTTQHYSLRDTGYDAPERDSETPASRPEPPRDGVRRGVYRAAESEPAAETESAEEKEPEPAPEPEPELKAEPEPAPETRPASKSKPTGEVKRASAKSGDMRVFDDAEPEPEAAEEPEPEPEPAPKPAPKRTEPLRPAPPPEPKKKDISDWDPNEG
ncbi:hypothetical protein [Archangium lansingense]|uniref:Uncharacterized protein n=1 Tax=Archangium lansingense TaxID=2995310 RepID=A0ABT4AJS7_9BACT|nr:hypothetical protein [Archangium lansinium]MCY1081409.1 hypothetical protein [Archangium lansinium]